MPTKTGRNDPCSRGSGKKYKHCCLEKDQAAACYRHVIEFARARPEQYEPEFAIAFHKLVAQLDPTAEWVPT